MDFMVTPWISQSEWNKVCNLIVSLEASKLRKAEEIISAWQCRVYRLPTGVETTLCLIQAAIAWSENPDAVHLPLTISSAIIRFLNLTCHVGLNKFGLTKIHDVAEKFNIPKSLVDLRHDMTHGEMRSKDSLLEGLAMALHWTLKNYWQCEDGKSNSALYIDASDREDFEITEECDEYKTFRVWLECFQYLKIYSIWDHETLAELKDDPDTYDHIAKLWNQLIFTNKQKQNVQSPKLKRRKKSLSMNISSEEAVGNVDKVRIREAIGLIRNELQSFLSRRSPIMNETFVKALVTEHLLLPEKDFAESLLEDDEAEERLLTSLRQSPKLPRTLAKSWSDLLKLLAEYDVLPRLVKALHDVCDDSNPRLNSFGKDLATSWICEILKSISNKSAPVKTKPKQKVLEKTALKNDHFKLNFVEIKTDVWQSVFQQILMSPNDRSFSVLPLISRMMEPPLSQLQEKKIHELMDILLGKKLGDSSKQAPVIEIKTLDSVINSGHEPVGEWRLVDSIDWSSVPLGLCPGQTEEGFLEKLESLAESVAYPEWTHPKLTFMDNLLAEEGEENRMNVNRFESQNDQSDVPAFYRSK